MLTVAALRRGTTPEQLITGDERGTAGRLSTSYSRLDRRDHAVMVVVKVRKRRINLGRPQVRMLPQNLLRGPAVKILLRGNVLDGVPSALDDGLAVIREDDMWVCVSSRYFKTPSDSGEPDSTARQEPPPSRSCSRRLAARVAGATTAARAIADAQATPATQ